MTTLVGAFLVGRPWTWGVHAVVVIVFAAYLAGLRRLQRLAVERRIKVRYLPATTPTQAPAPASVDERRGAVSR